VSRYQKGKTSLNFTEVRDSDWQWHQQGHMQVCTLLQTDNHTRTPPLLCFLQAGCPSCCPTNSIKALEAINTNSKYKRNKNYSENLHICQKFVMPSANNSYISKIAITNAQMHTLGNFEMAQLNSQ